MPISVGAPRLLLRRLREVMAERVPVVFESYLKVTDAWLSVASSAAVE